MIKLYSSGIIVLSLAFSLATRGNTQDLERLPDDPTQEEYVSGLPDDSASTLQQVSEEATVDEDIDTMSILSKYDHLDPNRIVPSRALKAAVVYFDKNKSRIRNKNYISVINFGQSSKEKRFYIINMKTGAVWALHVSHGKGSDSDHDGYAERFSNASGSNASSLGFYLTAETYYGSKGYSLKLDGKSSTNSNARARAIVIHGASYVQEARVIQGRSWGCPAVSMSYRTRVINMLKGGSLIYAVR